MNVGQFDVSYLSIDSIQEGVGASQILPLIFGLARRDMRISLVSFEKESPDVELMNDLKLLKIDWLPLPFLKNGPIGGLQRLTTLRGAIPSASVLHGRSDIPTAAAALSRLDIPILWDVRSLWSDQRYLIGTRGWNVITKRGARQLENISAAKAIAMTTLTRAVIPILENRHNKLPKIREVIPTCVDTVRFKPSPMPNGKLICLLSGTYNNYYDMTRTKQILDYLRSQCELYVIWARGKESLNLSLGIGEDVVVTIKHENMPKLVEQSHFGIAICKPELGESLTGAVPTKIGEFLASGRPVIVSQGIGDLDELFIEDTCGIVVRHEDQLESLIPRLFKIINDSNTPERCRNLALDHFSMTKAIDTYSSLYTKMLKSHH